jgi:cell wall-associated NlpC family hydrolase
MASHLVTLIRSAPLVALLAAGSLAVAPAVHARAGAGVPAALQPVVLAAGEVDGVCDPTDDAGDPDCWDDGSGDTGDTGDSGDSGDTGDWPDDPGQTEDPEPPEDTPVVQWPAPPKGAYAKLRPDGRTATAPKSAPKPVRAMIRAANQLTRKPYRWGGGHRRWYDRGYDCSGATSFVLRAGGFLQWPLDSGGFAKWGVRGAGNWVRIYANRTHVFMVVAGLRFDTSAYGAAGGQGPRWRSTVRPTKGFQLRHPAGL